MTGFRKYVIIILTTLIVPFAGTNMASASDYVIGQPLEDVATDTYMPAVELTKTCTYVTSPYGAELTGVGLNGRFSNRYSDYPAGYEMILVDDWDQPLAGAGAFVKAGKRSGSFVVVPKGEPSDNLVHMIVRAADTEFAYMDFTPSSLCEEFYASPMYNKGKLRLTFKSKCTVRSPLEANELCKFTSTTLKVKNLSKSTAKVKVRSMELTSSDAFANNGPSSTKKIKAKKSKTFQLIKHKAGKVYCYVGTCSTQFGELYHFEIVNRGITVGGVWWNSNVPPWRGLSVPLWDYVVMN